MFIWILIWFHFCSGNPFHCCFRGSPAFWAAVSYSKVVNKDDVVIALFLVKMIRTNGCFFILTTDSYFSVIFSFSNVNLISISYSCCRWPNHILKPPWSFRSGLQLLPPFCSWFSLQAQPSFCRSHYSRQLILSINQPFARCLALRRILKVVFQLFYITVFHFLALLSVVYRQSFL